MHIYYNIGIYMVQRKIQSKKNIFGGTVQRTSTVQATVKVLYLTNGSSTKNIKQCSHVARQICVYLDETITCETAFARGKLCLHCANKTQTACITLYNLEFNSHHRRMSLGISVGIHVCTFTDIHRI